MKSKKYNIVQKSDRKIVERGQIDNTCTNTDIHYRSLTSLASVTTIKGKKRQVKLFF